MKGGDTGKKDDIGSRWRDDLKAILRQRPCELVGIGNPIRRDDSAGLFVIRHLRKKYGKHPSEGVVIHDPITAPELVRLKLSYKNARVIVFDSAEMNMKPGSIMLANISDSRYGFFATHNIPLKLIPYFAEHPEKTWIVGIQPEDVSIGEGLSNTAMKSVKELVSFFGIIFEGEAE
ncbi:MAG: hydrogenase maturation protease [Conexivisphaerales archaeon]